MARKTLSCLALVIASVELATLAAIADDPTLSVTIDCNDRGALISPLLFGHNLEVTRRDIWSGLGAEIIANRKFAAVANGLPKRWIVTGEGVTAALEEKDAFVGKNSMGLTLGTKGGGLAQQQETLSFHKGRRYSFRFWLKSGEPRRLSLRIAGSNETQVVCAVAKKLRPGGWQLWAGEFVAAVGVTNARLEIGSQTPGTFWIGAGSVQPADSFHGMRRDVLALLKQIKPGALRFPGGCYAEFYRWQDGLLQVDLRPPIAPTGLDFLLRDSDDVDTQELGIDEFIALCREVGCEPAITVRLSETSPADAAAWVEYCNGSAKTKWGKLRAERGQRKPYEVKTWLLGNELYFFGRGGMKDANNCARQTAAFAEAIRKAGPSVRLVGCTYTKKWNKPLLDQAGGLLNYASFHDYMLDSFKPRDLEKIAKAPTLHLRPLLKQFHDAMPLPTVIDEWNTLWGTAGTGGMGLYAAGVLNLLAREAESLGVAQAYFFQPITEGAIRVTPLEASLDSAGFAFDLQKIHQGNRRLKTPDLPADADLDICASLTTDRKRVQVTAINRSTSSEHTLSLSVTNIAGPVHYEIKFLWPRTLDMKEVAFLECEKKPRLVDGTTVELRIPPCTVARVSVVATKGGHQNSRARR